MDAGRLRGQPVHGGPSGPAVETIEGERMCGIVACRTASGATEFLLPALRQLEYRGYDSAGVAVCDPGAGELRWSERRVAFSPCSVRWTPGDSR